MIFASYEFIFLFFPIVIIGYFLLSKFQSLKLQHSFFGNCIIGFLFMV